MKPCSRLWRFTMWVADHPAEATVAAIILAILLPLTVLLWRITIQYVASC